MLLAVDPGTKATGWSRFENGLLFDCGLVRGKAWMETLDNFPEWDTPPDILFIEDQRPYHSSFKRNSDLIKLAHLCGGLIAKIKAPETHVIAPTKWKGTVPKLIHNKRVVKRLDDLERLKLTRSESPLGLKHNIVDAIGIGLWALGRME